MLCVFDTAQERNTAARRRAWMEDPERRSEEQVCVLGLSLLVVFPSYDNYGRVTLLLKDSYVMMIQNKEKLSSDVIPQLIN